MVVGGGGVGEVGTIITGVVIIVGFVKEPVCVTENVLCSGMILEELVCDSWTVVVVGI